MGASFWFTQNLYLWLCANQDQGFINQSMQAFEKKTATFLLISLVCLQSGGLFLFYKCQQWHVQYEQMRRAVSDKQAFLKISLPIADFERCKINEREIKFQEKLYDIYSIKMDLDSVQLTVVHDWREESILEKIMDLVSQDFPDHKQIPVQVLKLLQLSYICPHYVQPSDIMPLRRQHHFRFSFDWNTRRPEIPFPPPKVV